MTTPELAGNPCEIDLVQQPVAKAEPRQLSVAHICVMADSGMGKVLEQAWLTKVRTLPRYAVEHRRTGGVGTP